MSTSYQVLETVTGDIIMNLADMRFISARGSLADIPSHPRTISSLSLVCSFHSRST